jgi:hypothetical protein
MFEDIKDVIKNPISKKRQTIQWPKEKRTPNYEQNTTQKTEYRVTRTPPGVNSGPPEG